MTGVTAIRNGVEVTVCCGFSLLRAMSSASDKPSMNSPPGRSIIASPLSMTQRGWRMRRFFVEERRGRVTEPASGDEEHGRDDQPRRCLAVEEGERAGSTAEDDAEHNDARQRQLVETLDERRPGRERRALGWVQRRAARRPAGDAGAGEQPGREG